MEYLRMISFESVHKRQTCLTYRHGERPQQQQQVANILIISNELSGDYHNNGEEVNPHPFEFVSIFCESVYTIFKFVLLLVVAIAKLLLPFSKLIIIWPKA